MARDPDAEYVSIKAPDEQGNHPDWVRLAKQKKLTLGKLTEKVLNIAVANPDRFFDQKSCPNGQTTASSGGEKDGG